MKESYTIHGFEKLTQQEIFDKAAHHILSTGKKSVEECGTCTYSGSGCAAAPFIKPEYRDHVVGVWPPVWNSMEMHRRKGFNRPMHEGDLIRAIQVCHDRSTNDKGFVSEFKERMRVVAIRYNLNTKALS